MYNDGMKESYTRNIEVFNVTDVVRDEESGTLAAPRSLDVDVISDLPSDGGDVAGCPYRSLRAASKSFTAYKCNILC